MKKTIFKYGQLEILKKVNTVPCYICSELTKKQIKKYKCIRCKGTGKYKEIHYFHIYTQKDGTKMCIEGDSLK